MRAIRLFVASFAAFVLVSAGTMSGINAQEEPTASATQEATATPSFVPSVTETTTMTPVIEATLDPCLNEEFEQQGEVFEECTTATPTSTIDPCSVFGFDGSGEEVDPCETPSSTPTATESVPTPAPTLTPTLEYEIDVPVSYFPDETIEPDNEETVAAAETEVARGTSTPEKLEVVTGLPNTGANGPGTGDGKMGMLILSFVLIGLISSALAIRARSSPR